MIGSGHSRLLKILHIDPEKNWGGGEAQLFGLFTYLAEQGHHNDLLTHPQGRLWEQSQKGNVRCLPLIVRNELDVRQIPRIRRLIRAEQYDVVHFHTKRAHALSPWLPRGQDRPRYVVTRRMDYPQTNNWYTRFLYNRAVDAVIAISGSIADILIEAGVDPGKIRVVHSGVDPARFTAPERGSASESGAPIIGTVAHLEARKGHRYLLQAARLLKERGYRFKVALAGEGSLKPALEEMVQSLALREEVTFLDFVSDVAKFLTAIDIFVLPSLYEGLGVAALEAMAAGKAVVASRVGGLADLVEDSETGFLVPPGDAEALAAAIAELLEKKAVREAFGQKAALHVREHFSMQEMAKRNEACYYAMLRGAA